MNEIKRNDSVFIRSGWRMNEQGVVINITRSQSKDDFDIYHVKFKEGNTMGYPKHMLRKEEK